jgi:hypothetical protein
MILLKREDRMSTIRPSRHALVVEPGGSENTSQLLRRSDFSVLRALRPLEAVIHFRDEVRFSLVLCDSAFPREEVISLFGQARQLNPMCTTALLCPDSAAEDGDIAAAYRADRVIRVPLSAFRWPLAAIGVR